jgi:hypothetical protein
VPTLYLVDRSESGGPDGPLATLALARRADDTMEKKVDQLMASRDAVMRVHAARGIAMGGLKDAVGRIAAAFAYETDPPTRRALIRTLAQRTGSDANAPLRLRTLETASRLDPDRVVRATAMLALRGATRESSPPHLEVAWLRLTGGDGAPPRGDMIGALYRSDGLAVPIAFDEEGYALVPGVPPGEARLVLAPRLPAYEPPRP